jgi:hypothetical protein
MTHIHLFLPAPSPFPYPLSLLSPPQVPVVATRSPYHSPYHRLRKHLPQPPQAPPSPRRNSLPEPPQALDAAANPWPDCPTPSSLEIDPPHLHLHPHSAQEAQIFSISQIQIERLQLITIRFFTLITITFVEPNKFRLLPILFTIPVAFKLPTSKQVEESNI